MPNKVAYFIKESWLLIVAALVFGLLLWFTEYAWGPRIEAQQQRKFTELAKGMIPEAEQFKMAYEDVELQVDDGRTIEVDIRKGVDDHGRTVGWAFTAEGAGYGGPIRLLIAVDEDYEKLAGYGVLTSTETPGYGDQIKNEYFKAQFRGTPAREIELAKDGEPEDTSDNVIVAISGATVTSQAMVDIMNSYIEPVKQFLQEKGEL